MNVYELVCDISENNKEVSNLLDTFHEGLSHYHNQDWDKAIKSFQISNTFEDNFEGRKTNPSLVFIERSKKFKENPPGEKWNGVYSLDSK